MPDMIYWRTRGGVILTSVFGAHADMAEARDHDGNKANHVVCRRYRPIVAVEWSTSPDGPWQKMDTCPIPAQQLKVKK